ncbi:rhombosortase [Bermanella sp. 47_1433_sub80_T6]|nr:rhombosortase [Bermanella sp. 47_1433_sub80_T6]
MLNFLSRFPVALWPIYLLLVMLLLTSLGESVTNLLRFDHQAIGHGEYWRLLSAHVVHLGWAHGLLNAGGLLMVAWMQPAGAPWRWLVFYVITSIVISMGLYLDGSVNTYVGASGVLHGLLIMAAFFSHWLEPWRKSLVVFAVTTKLLWEQTPWYSDASVSEMIGGYVVVDAHFLGGLAGLMVVVMALLKKSANSGAPS